MTIRTLCLPLVFVALLPACDARIGAPADEASGTATASASGKAADGQITLKAPGLDLSVNVPESLRNMAEVDPDGRLLPPGAALGGIHIQGGAGSGGGVEIRFTAPQAPPALVQWYQDAARTADFVVDAVQQEGTQAVISGHMSTGEASPFTVRVAPGAGGGSEAQLVLSDRQ